MKGIIRTLSILSIIPAMFRGTKTNPETGVIEPVKPRFIPGDKFYNYLPMKRVGGKWRVKR